MSIVYGHAVVEASGRALLPQRREQAAVARRPQRGVDARALGGRRSVVRPRERRRENRRDGALDRRVPAADHRRDDACCPHAQADLARVDGAPQPCHHIGRDGHGGGARRARRRAAQRLRDERALGAPGVAVHRRQSGTTAPRLGQRVAVLGEGRARRAGADHHVRRDLAPGRERQRDRRSVRSARRPRGGDAVDEAPGLARRLCLVGGLPGFALLAVAGAPSICDFAAWLGLVRLKAMHETTFKPRRPAFCAQPGLPTESTVC